MLLRQSSLLLGLKREDFHQEQEPNGQTKEEEEEGEEKDQEDNKEKEEEEEVKKEEVKEEEEDEEEASASPAGKLGVKVHLTPLELEGLWHLLNKLEELPTHKKCVPSGIRNAPALLNDIRVSGTHAHMHTCPRLVNDIRVRCTHAHMPPPCSATHTCN